MDIDDFVRGMGALPSPHDPTIVAFESLNRLENQIGEPFVKGGFTYVPFDIEDQFTVGICTAISFIQNRNKVNQKKYSPDFQYLLQKTFIDGNWLEGSSILSALKVGKNFGMLPLHLWTHTTEADRQLSYTDYSNKLKALTHEEINRLIALCVDKIADFATVDVSDPQFIAKAIMESEAGILARFGSGKTWYTDIMGKGSWQPKDIDPIRAPNPPTSGHAIGKIAFDFTNGHIFHNANTWGTKWDFQGQCNINWDNYKPTEAYTILRAPAVVPTPVFKFTQQMKLGTKGGQVKNLQLALMKNLGITLVLDGIFGAKTKLAVQEFQTKYSLQSDGEVGPITINKLNTI